MEMEENAIVTDNSVPNLEKIESTVEQANSDEKTVSPMPVTEDNANENIQIEKDNCTDSEDSSAPYLEKSEAVEKVDGEKDELTSNSEDSIPVLNPEESTKPHENKENDSDSVNNDECEENTVDEKSCEVEKIDPVNNKDSEQYVTEQKSDEIEKTDSENNNDLEKSAVDQTSCENEKNESLSEEENVATMNQNENEKDSVPAENENKTIKDIKSIQESCKAVESTETLMEVDKDDSVTDIKPVETSLEIEKDTDIPMEIVKDKIASSEEITEVAEISMTDKKETEILEDNITLEEMEKEAESLLKDTKISDASVDNEKNTENLLNDDKNIKSLIDEKNTKSLVDENKETFSNDEKNTKILSNNEENTEIANEKNTEITNDETIETLSNEEKNTKNLSNDEENTEIVNNEKNTEMLACNPKSVETISNNERNAETFSNSENNTETLIDNKKNTETLADNEIIAESVVDNKKKSENFSDAEKSTVNKETEAFVDISEVNKSATKIIEDEADDDDNDCMEIDIEDYNDDDEEASPDVENKTDVKEDVKEDVKSSMEVDEDYPLGKIVIEGIEEDENDSYLTMTLEEAHDYIQKKATMYMNDPNFNPLLNVNSKIESVLVEIRNKEEEMMKLIRAYESMNKDQCRFLRHTGNMPKNETREVGVGVDLEWLPETVSGLFQNGTKSSQLINGGTNVLIKPKKSSGPIECIDLTDEMDKTSKPKPATPDIKNAVISNSSSVSILPSSVRATTHPAPLPVSTPLFTLNSAEIPAKPKLKISVDKNGIVLQWDMPAQAKKITITGFEIFGYQEKPTIPVSSALWKKIGTVNPMPLPMSCTLTQFVEGYKYHFSIRGISNDKLGHFSDPATIMFVPKT